MTFWLKYRSSLYRSVSLIHTSMTSSTSGHVLKGVVNTKTGKHEWIVQNEDYDYMQEIARSAYADMLHDKDRNVAFRTGLEQTIERYKADGQPTRVLDIGTGTGFLAMTAARAVADQVTAIEAFTAIAETAKRIIKQNGYADKIRLIDSRSTEVYEKDINDRANICVAEVFDTELIGEGALRTFKEAHAQLLAPNSSVIPAKAVVYALPVQSDFITIFEKPTILKNDKLGFTIYPPPEFVKCPGHAAVHDVQLEQLPLNSFIPASDPIPVFTFDFENADKIVYDEFVSIPIKLNANVNRIDAVFMWWTLDMDGSGQNIVSTEPGWSVGRHVQWRDHWMQAVYYLPQSAIINGELKQVKLNAHHDEYSFWFGVGDEKKSERPVCTCGLHMFFSRSQLAFHSNYSAFPIDAIATLVRNKCVLYIGDSFIFPNILHKLGAKRVFCIMLSSHSIEIAKRYAEHNDIVGIEFIDYLGANDIDMDILKSFDVLNCTISDMFFTTTILPWDTLQFYYVVKHLLNKQYITNINVQQSISIMCMPVQFDNLWKIKSPVRTLEGFDVSIFDRAVQHAIQLTDCPVEPHPLWEYPSVATDTPKELIRFHFDQFNASDCQFNSSIQFKLQSSKSNINTHAIVFWTEHYLEDGTSWSDGIKNECLIGQKPTWNIFTQQGVCFINPEDIKQLSNNLIVQFSMDKDSNVKIEYTVN